MKGQFYDLNRILKAYPEALYYMIFGERSNGKTFSVLEYGLRHYWKTGGQIAILRRWREDFIGVRGASMFDAIVATGLVKSITGGEWEDIYYYSSRWFLCRYDDAGNRIKDREPFCYGFSLTSMEHDKGSSFPHIQTIFFDEFMSRSDYLSNEYILFKNTLCTIIRQRNDVKIFMCGNTVNKYCPYFSEMGLKHVKKMKPGDIDFYRYGESGTTTVAVEYTEPGVKGKKSDIYFAFDNPRLKMITSGEWEIDIYPHLPHKYKPRDVVFEFFVEFDDELLHADIVCTEVDTFIFIYPKPDEIKEPDRDIVYSTQHNAGPNWRRNILKPCDKIDHKIYSLFKQDKVFYATNETGEVMRNYVEWCAKN